MKIFDIITRHKLPPFMLNEMGQGRPDLLAFDSRPSAFLYFFQARRAAFKGWGFHKCQKSFHFHRSLKNVVPTTPQPILARISNDKPF